MCVLQRKKEMSLSSLLICSMNTFVLYIMLYSLSALSFVSSIHEQSVSSILFMVTLWFTSKTGLYSTQCSYNNTGSILS